MISKKRTVVWIEIGLWGSLTLIFLIHFYFNKFDTLWSHRSAGFGLGTTLFEASRSVHVHFFRNDRMYCSLDMPISLLNASNFLAFPSSRSSTKLLNHCINNTWITNDKNNTVYKLNSGEKVPPGFFKLKYDRIEFLVYHIGLNKEKMQIYSKEIYKANYNVTNFFF